MYNEKINRFRKNKFAPKSLDFLGQNGEVVKKSYQLICFEQERKSPL